MARKIPGFTAKGALAGCLLIAVAAAAQQTPPGGRRLPPGVVPAAPAPAPAPASAPASGPSSSPASMPTSSPYTEKGQWADAQVGTTVQYKLGGGTMQTWEVVKVEANTVTIKISTALAGVKPTESDVPRMYTPDELALAMTVYGRKTGDEKLQVGEKEYACDVYDRVMILSERKILNRTWLCKEVPGWSVRVDNNASGEMKTISLVVEIKH